MLTSGRQFQKNSQYNSCYPGIKIITEENSNMAFAPVGYGNVGLANRAGFAQQGNTSNNTATGIGNTINNDQSNNFQQNTVNNDGRTINNITINYNEAAEAPGNCKEAGKGKGKGKAKGKGKGKGKAKDKKAGKAGAARGPQSPQRMMMSMMKMMMNMMSQMQGGGMAGGGFPGNSVNINMGGFGRPPGFF
jgi:hypothetical protein